MGFTPFNETYLEISMYVLLGCSAVVGLGGILLLLRSKWGVSLVAWQAMLSIATNSIVVFVIALMAFGVLTMRWTSEALALRLGSIVVNVVLWRLVKSRAVTEFFAARSSAARACNRAPGFSAQA